MNLKELAFPIRVYWDVTPAPDNLTINYTGICEEILEIKVLTLSLLDTDFQLSNSCIEILEKLKNENIAVVLTVSHSALNSSTMALLSHLKVNELLVEASMDDDFRSLAEIVRQYKNKNMMLGASFKVNKDNYRNIPDVVAFCLNNNITRLVFPMLRLTMKSNYFYVSREEGKALALKLHEIKIDNMKLRIHDPFLWRVFYPAITFPGGGCQAANSMVYISSDGNLYPCPSMPLALGNLRETPLKTILSSAYKKGLMKSLLDPPEECLGCGELNECKGGCRGRAYVVHKTFDKRDPACAAH